MTRLPLLLPAPAPSTCFRAKTLVYCCHLKPAKGLSLKASLSSVWSVPRSLYDGAQPLAQEDWGKALTESGWYWAEEELKTYYFIGGNDGVGKNGTGGKGKVEQ